MENQPVDTPVSFRPVEEKGVLIGDQISLYNRNLYVIGEVSDYSGQIIDIISVSDSLFTDGSNFCQSFWYVEIRVAGQTGVVNGRQVFRIINSDHDTSFGNESNRIELLTTEFYGMGNTFEGDLVGCQVNQPVLFRDYETNYFGLIRLNENKFSRLANIQNLFPYFELKSDDQRDDKIQSISTNDDGIRLTIHRTFHEGFSDYEVLISRSENQYIATFLSYQEGKNW